MAERGKSDRVAGIFQHAARTGALNTQQLAAGDRSLVAYLAGTSAWFSGIGVQGVMFAWLVTMVLNQSPELVGVAQMAFLLPGTLLMLVGGSLADQFGARRVLLLSQGFAVLPPLLLALAITLGALSYATMLTFAVFMGLAAAFANPSRDGLLNQVASGRVQRTVVQASLMQFGGQILGLMLASIADLTGAVPVLLIQSTLLFAGLLAFLRVRVVEQPAERRVSRLAALRASVIEGAATVWRSNAMRMVMVQNGAMALFFMGSFIVTLPLLVREVYAVQASGLAWVMAANSAGLVSTIYMLLRFGDVERRGRALILAQLAGCFLLAAPAFFVDYTGLLLAFYLWGTCGGVAMSMARTIMQEYAPPQQRGRVMAFYGLSFMGFGPLGALLCGYLVELFGPQAALAVAAACMFLVVVVVGLGSGLWRVAGHDGPPAG